VTYVRPAAFHANAIVMVGCGFVGLVRFAGCGWALRKVGDLRRDFANAAQSSTSRDKVLYSTPTCGRSRIWSAICGTQNAENIRNYKFGICIMFITFS
jgi:hypothetical protein